jgi:two-component system response regulator PilR (NtrC family)
LVAETKFRHDLYYRINVIELRVPPLRERSGDILPLAEAILRRLAQENGDPPYRLNDDAALALKAYPFPGNVRELENILERAVALCDSGSIGADDLHLPRAAAMFAPEAGHAATLPSSSTAAPSGPVEPAAVAASGSAPTSARLPSEPLTDFIEQVEREAIMKALEECRYNKTKAAAKLGITFRALRYKLKKLGID